VAAGRGDADRLLYPGKALPAEQAPGNWIITTAIPAITKKVGWSLFTVILAGVTTLRGQSANDAFSPNANATVRAVVVQPDGKILIGGDFTTLSPNGGGAVTRNHIARLNPDGTLDATFNPNANGVVDAIAVQADGKVLAGGVFTAIGGQSRNFFARLDATTGAADSFNPSPNSDVLVIAVQADGKILAGGDFNSSNGTPTIGGAMRNNLARLDPTTGLADSFDPNADSTVYAIVAEANGQVLISGNFNNLAPNGGGTITRHHIARVTSAGLADSFAPDANGIVYSMAVQTDGKIVVGGAFFGTGSIGGQTRNYIARLDPATGLADSYNANATAQINAVAVQADGKIVVGGNFSGANSIGGQTRGRIARLDPVTGLADSFDPNANLPVLVIALQQDGKVLAGGQFTTLSPDGEQPKTCNHIGRLETDGRQEQTLNPGFNGFDVGPIVLQPDGKFLIGGNFIQVGSGDHNYIARLNTDGTDDFFFDPSADDVVESLAVQSDGKILVGGAFSHMNGVSRGEIARLSPNGTLDTGFDPNANSDVFAIVIQPDGKIVIGGDFKFLTPNGGATVARNYIARVNADGTLDTNFNPNANGDVYTIALQADGKIVVGGAFTAIGGQARNSFARLDPVTGQADSFNPNPDGIVSCILVQGDGKILVGGAFSNISGTARNHIARLDSTTGAPDSFNPNANNGPNTIALEADGKILAGGSFTSVGGVTRNHIARLDSTTGVPDSFNPNVNGDVITIVLEADGKILTSGAFSSAGGQNVFFLARLTNDTAALQNLAVTQTTVTWTRSGSSPQFSRVTFEFSTDNMTYTSLGTGTASGSTWTLAGLGLPLAQNFYVRARGYDDSCVFDGASGIVESVRAAFIPAVLKIVSITRSANGHAILQCLGLPNQVNDLQVSPNLSSGSFTTVSPGPGAADSTGAFQYDDAGAVGLTKRFYRLAFP
jgi:uncharacterized delta-60 repeat protein